MGILGIGIDIVSLQRIVDVAQRRSARKLAQRVLSPIEFSEWHSRKVATGSSFDSSRFLAVRWAVKEAAYKAMFPAYRPTWKELSYTSRNVSQKPSLKYDGNNHKDITLHVSVSHDGDYVVAQVLAEYDRTSR